MNLLKRLTYKNLKLNKKRTIVTIIGVMLSVALLTAVTTIYMSLLNSVVKFEKHEEGDFHVAFYNIDINDVKAIKNNAKVDKVFLTKDVGYAYLEDSKNDYKPYIFVKAFTKESLKRLSVNLIEGELPKNENEIIIPTHLKTNGRVEYKVGDTITINVGKRIYNEIEYDQDMPYMEDEKIIDTKEVTYKIVGITERPAKNIEPYDAPGYTFITYIDEKDIDGMVSAYAKYTKKGSKDYEKVTANIIGLNEEKFYKYINNELTDKEVLKFEEELANTKYDLKLNEYLILLENDPFGQKEDPGFAIVILIVCGIIVITSVFCIKNSFDISITEKIKQYGMLRSVGATKKQIKKNVLYEAFIIGTIGIIFGIALGLLASSILVMITNYLLNSAMADNFSIELSYSFIAIIFSILLGIITVYFSAIYSAIKASKVSPISSIRDSANIKIKFKKLKCPKLISKIFKIGGEISYKNMKRNKRKYRTTIISIILSTSIFIALSYFMNTTFRIIKDEVTNIDYNIIVDEYVDNDINKINRLESLVNLDNVDSYAIYKETYFKLEDPKFNSKYSPSKEEYIALVSLNNEEYNKFLKNIELIPSKLENKVLLIDNGIEESTGETFSIFEYKENDLIKVNINNKIVGFEIGKIIKKDILNNFYDKVIVMNNDLFEKYVNKVDTMDIYLNTKEDEKLQKEIEDIMKNEDYYLHNRDEEARTINNLYLLIGIFLYGFIIVISLIGVTNIFNTITTSMELRKQEFAMLKSIGMTNSEFKRMIRLESIFIGTKALLFSIPIGISLSYLMYIALEDPYNFHIPFKAIIISIMVVFVLIMIIMKYSMGKINKQNIIETIRNENI